MQNSIRFLTYIRVAWSGHRKHINQLLEVAVCLAEAEAFSGLMPVVHAYVQVEYTLQISVAEKVFIGF